MLNPIEAVKSAERCQRNWDHSKPISDEDIKKIVEVATTMPTKNNRSYYELIVSTNRNFNRMCYEHATDPNNKHFTDRKIHRNTQVDAPLLLIWRPTDLDEIDNPFDENYKKDFLVSIGISSGAAVLTANQLGYKTGYCGCIRNKELFKKIETDYRIPVTNNNYSDGLIVGFGNPDTSFSRVDCVLDGEHGYTAETVDKNININYIK